MTARQLHGVDGADERAPMVARLRLALDMFATGEALMRQNLRRRFPDAADAEIERRLGRWLRDRPPDCPGPSRPLGGGRNSGSSASQG